MSVILRPEAKPLAYDRLTHFQFEAARRLVGTLETAVRQLPAPHAAPTESTVEHLDSNRASRLFFLSGEPGTGKTSLYLALRHALKSRGRKKLVFPARTGASIDLSQLDGRIVWLAPLDLEAAAPSTTNYLAAVIIRIDRAISDAFASNPQQSRGLLERSHGYSDALIDFQRLKTNIGLAWDGNQPRRAETVDPDAFAEEVLRAENARLCINEQLNNVLENLVPEAFGNEVNNPILVLPVDDLYLDPTASLEFLRLMRMISTPRLFILAMGELRIIEELFYQKILGDLVSLAGEGSYIRDPRQRQVLPARARRLTFQSLRKLIPPAQRYEMEPLYWSEALDFSLSQLLEKDTESPFTQHTLGHLLELVPLSIEGHDLLRPETWMDFLRTPGNPEIRTNYAEQEDPGKPTPLSSPDALGYTGLQILEAPVRNVLDLWLAVEDSLPQDGKRSKSEILEPAQKNLLKLVVDQALLSLNEQDCLTNEDREKFETAISGTQYIPQRLDTTLLDASAERGPAMKFSVDELSYSFYTHRRWLLCPDNKKDKFSKENLLPPRPTAWFVLLHDLLVLLKDEDLYGLPLTPGEMRWAENNMRDGEKETTLYWPLPKWPSFWQFDIFLCAWNHLLDKLRKEGDIESELDRIVFHWIDLAARVFLYKFPGQEFFGSTGLPAAKWDELEKHIKELTKIAGEGVQASVQFQGLKDWLNSLKKMKRLLPVNLRKCLSTFWKSEPDSTSKSEAG